MVKYYSNLLAPYHPGKEISETSQLQYYEFVKGLYEGLFNRPESFFAKLSEDDAHPNRFNCREYGKPGLKPLMKKAADKVEELFQILLNIGSEGEVAEEGLLIKSEISKKQRNLLTYMNFKVLEGILKHEEYPEIAASIKYLSGKEKPLWSLMFCWFDDSYPYLEKTNEKFYDREQFKRLTDWLQENGYRISIGSGSGITLDYFKSIRTKADPVGYAIHGDKYHYGFTFEYRYEPRVMQHCEPRIIQFTEVLKHFDELAVKTKQLILNRTKICDGCHYCNQTDKTGKRPIAAIKLMDGTSRCPYYPGFNYTFESLHTEDVDTIISFLTDLENQIIHKN